MVSIMVSGIDRILKGRAANGGTLEVYSNLSDANNRIAEGRFIMMTAKQSFIPTNLSELSLFLVDNS